MKRIVPDQFQKMKQRSTSRQKDSTNSPAQDFQTPGQALRSHGTTNFNLPASASYKIVGGGASKMTSMRHSPPFEVSQVRSNGAISSRPFLNVDSAGQPQAVLSFLNRHQIAQSGSQTDTKSWQDQIYLGQQQPQLQLNADKKQQEQAHFQYPLTQRDQLQTKEHLQRMASRDSSNTNGVSSSLKTPVFKLNVTDGDQSNIYGQSITSNSIQLLSSTKDKEMTGGTINSRKPPQTLRQQQQNSVSQPAIALNNTQKLSQEFKQVHLDLADSIAKLRTQAAAKNERTTVVLNRDTLETLLSNLTANTKLLGRLGNDMEKLCVSLSESLYTSLNKTSTLRKKIKLMQKEKTMSATRQKSQREREMQKTKAMFERSLSEIRNAYERSQRTKNNDYLEMEKMAKRMRDYRVEIGDIRRQNFNIIQQRSHETISRIPVATANGTSPEDELFRDSDLIRTSKQTNAFVGEPFPCRNRGSQVESSGGARPTDQSRKSLPGREQLIQTNSFFSNQQLAPPSDELELTNKFTDPSIIVAQDQNLSAVDLVPRMSSAPRLMIFATPASGNRQNFRSHRPDQNSAGATPIHPAQHLPQDANKDTKNDNLQIINDSLISEPVSADQSNFRSRNGSVFAPHNQKQNEATAGKNILENSITGISEIQAPAMMLQPDLCGGWDSQLDIDTSVMQMEPSEMNQLQKQFVEQYSAIKDKNQKILFRQFFALHHRVNTSMLQSQLQSNYTTQDRGSEVMSKIKQVKQHSELTESAPASRALPQSSKDATKFEGNRAESKSIDLGQNEKLLQSSLAETTKRKVEGNEAESGSEDDKARKLRKAYASQQQSASKRLLEDDRHVGLKELLDIPDQFSLQSPLPPLCDSDDPVSGHQQVQAFEKQNESRDVQLADILQAPSLEISLRTATELDENSDEASLKRYDSGEKSPITMQQLETVQQPVKKAIHSICKAPPEHCQQQSGIQILQEGLQPASVFLQGTIYSDGKSSSMLSPQNETRTIVSLQGQQPPNQCTTLTSIQQEDVDSEDSSLLISEETQANKRTQSSCKKRKLSGSTRNSATTKSRLDGVSAVKTSDGKHSSISSRLRQDDSSVAVSRKLVFDQTQLDQTQNHLANIQKQLMIVPGSRNVRAIYNSSMQSQNSIDVGSQKYSIYQQATGSQQLPFRQNDYRSQGLQIQKHPIVRTNDYCVEPSLRRMSSKASKPPQASLTIVKSHEQAPVKQAQKSSIVVKPVPIKLLKKAMFRSVDKEKEVSEAPPTGLAASKLNKNNCSSTTLGSCQGSIKVSNKRIQVIKTNRSKSNGASLSNSILTQHQRYNTNSIAEYSTDSVPRADLESGCKISRNAIKLKLRSGENI